MQSCRMLTLVVGPSCSDHFALKGLAIILILFFTGSCGLLI